MSNSNATDITLTHREDNNSRNSLRIPDGFSPFVRYAETGDNGKPDQFHRLHSIREPVPAVADFVSPVYLLTDEQVAKHDELVSKNDRFNVRDYKSIATKIQTECEDDGRVCYPVFVESDADVDYYEMREGLKRFVRKVLEVDPTEAKWFFSGGSSLHVHLPYYVNENAIERLRRETKQYNKNATVTVDASNFTKKSLVRLPGAKHHDTGIRKAPISPTSSDEKLQARIAQLVGGDATEGEEGISYYAGTSEIVRYSLYEELGLIKEIPTPIIEQRDKPVGTGNVELWKRYNRHPFCPYANAGNQRRSIVVAQIKGTPFCRKTTVNGIESGRTYIPTFIYGAVSADSEYTVWQENAPVQLSKQDHKKWDYEQGDTVVLLGGNSTSSRIIELEDTFERDWVASQLLPDMDWIDDSTDGRKEALNALCAFGYEVGSAGKNGPRRENSTNSRDFRITDTYRLQKQAEQDGVETLSHDKRRKVANRLLYIRGWDGADEWFQEQYGEQYDREITHEQLRSIASEYNDLPLPPKGE
ncbi:hypothetical protein [Halopiger djelfimassiliensis]|uniref:hypothetical protein n=1 Tax=Halopiger djelfimassiliensis TaxID=1293047 RepID=UPI00067778FC|nr:hypothetical protein [Halopiger djelfimassiliensis]